MTQYKRISIEEREKIEELYEKHYTVSAIARILNRNKSGISRELRRFGDPKLYEAIVAEASFVGMLSRNKAKFTNREMRDYVVSKITLDRWSPGAIAGRLKLESKLGLSISHETIYKFIHSNEGMALNLYRYLRRPKLKRGWTRKASKVNTIRDLKPIWERPTHINNRRDFGHCEGDLLIISSVRNRNIISVIERKSRYCWLIDNTSKASAPIIAKIKAIFELFPGNFKSITFDRGKEFAMHKNLMVDTYFCNPHSPWQKGAVENLNARVRTFLPRNASIRYMGGTVDWIQKIINNTPMKVLGYRTPLEAFNKLKSDVLR